MSKQIIMIEGCDRTGKSTFISMLKTKLKEVGKIPFIFHLMGPTKFKELVFNNDDKSLIQLAKFDDEYAIIREIINSNPNIVVILDRTAFGEYIWTKYWNRTGKYTEYVNSPNFFTRHQDLYDRSLYIYFWMSNIYSLEKRIKESEEDTMIFTQNNKTIEENIMDVYRYYEDLSKLIIKHTGMSYIGYDNSSTLDDLDKMANEIINKI